MQDCLNFITNAVKDEKRKDSMTQKIKNLFRSDDPRIGKIKDGSILLRCGDNLYMLCAKCTRLSESDQDIKCFICESMRADEHNKMIEICKWLDAKLVNGTVKCKNNHEFEIKSKDVLEGCKWCPKCPVPSKLKSACSKNVKNARVERAKNKFDKIISDMEATAPGGYCGSSTKISIKCRKGHTFPARPNSIICRTTWCKKCNKINREICKFVHSGAEKSFLLEGVGLFSVYVPKYKLIIEVADIMTDKDKKKRKSAISMGYQYVNVKSHEITRQMIEIMSNI